MKAFALTEFSNHPICKSPESNDARLLVFNLVSQFSERTQGHLILNIHRNLDKVAALFPEAKIIHIIRDPRDVARSCIGMGWAGTTYFGIDPWLVAEMSWDKFGPTFNRSDVMELYYEDLISKPEEQLTTVCKFIGVSFSPDMLKYPNHSTYEFPKPSAIQQWRKKLPARDVALVEIKAGRLLVDRHYELSGHPLNPPSVRERLSLIFKNKMYIYKFAGRRYGYLNFIMEKATRKLFRPIHSLLVQRMNEIDKRHLKT